MNPVVAPKPGCSKTRAWKDRKAAREALLKRWAAGDYTMSGTHWCAVHRAFHMTKQMRRTGKNYRYRE